MQTALILCRFVHFGVLLTLFGIYFSQDVLLRTRLDLIRHLQPERAMRWLAGVALVSALAWLMLTAASMAGSWSDGFDFSTLLLVLGHTSFGKYWVWHLGLNLMLLLLLLLPNSDRRKTLRITLATLLLATLAPVGHVAMFEGVYGGLLIFNQFIHLLAVGAWLGGLSLLMLLLRCNHDEHLRTVLLRFGGFGYAMVALIIITGLVNVRVMSGAPWPEPAFSGFGLVLAIKVTMVLCMLALALFNRLMLNRAHLRLDIVRGSVAVECLFGIAALAAVSLLGTLPPMLAD